MKEVWKEGMGDKGNNDGMEIMAWKLYKRDEMD